MDKEYQLIILGGGPAALTAGIYAARSRLKTLLIEKGLLGGLIANAEWVENFPGFPDGISGLELAGLMQKQAEKFGIVTLYAEVTGLEVLGKQKIVKTTEGDFLAQAVIIACGSERINLNVPGEKEFTGRGVSYCATCDAAFFKDRPVAVVGGGNSAISEALHLAKFSSRVTVIHRRDQLRASRIVEEKARSEPKIDFIWNTIVEAIEGTETVERLRLNNVITGLKTDFPVKGVFISIGQRPNTAFLRGVVDLDANGYIITNEKMETSVPGILAAGDIRANSIRQTISAAGDGATAAVYAERYLLG
ncbi:MAG: thioredoxin-disulfide reductase [Dehalococcoidales bacterium]|jgi:thioredoxin reductase (NADPH)|nr:thioredoxin-disulfide reductase [Dehalococcoidales bacterium]